MGLKDFIIIDGVLEKYSSNDDPVQIKIAYI